MAIRGFEITNGKVKQKSPADNICGLMANGVEVGTTLLFAVAYKLTRLKDAELLGLNAAYDSANHVRIYRHISEFYRMAGEGTTLWFMLTDEVAPADMFGANYGQKLIIASKGTISYLAVASNPAPSYVPVMVDGLEQEVRLAIEAAQVFYQWTWDTDRPIWLALEGRGIADDVNSLLNLREMTSENNRVTLCVGQDWAYAQTQNSIGKKFADVGTLLGTKASISCNRSFAEVETLDISDAAKSVWLTAGLSNGKTIEELDADLSEYDLRGYVFGLNYVGSTGIRWNNDHVCSPEGMDDDGFIKISTVGHAATVNKAARKLRAKMLPKVKSTVPMDSKTGLLPQGIVTLFESYGDAAFETMQTAGEISDGKTYVDPASDLISGEKALVVDFIVVPTATIGTIKGTITLKKTI